VWTIKSNIGSTIDQNGNYIAGLNFDVFTKATDLVVVTDISNGGISAQATVDVFFGCFLLQIYGENSEEAKLLRYFRDNVLNTTPEGKELIKLYYEWSPLIDELIKEDEEFKEEVKEMVDGILQVIRGEVE